ncbi:MAG: hypothetical protein ABIK28_24725 [Planctomycetota bacterium]
MRLVMPFTCFISNIPFERFACRDGSSALFLHCIQPAPDPSGQQQILCREIVITVYRYEMIDVSEEAEPRAALRNDRIRIPHVTESRKTGVPAETIL